MSALFTIEIDNETYPAPEKTMTANAILALGELDPKQNYLIQIKRDSRISYKDKGEVEIDLFEGAKFVSHYLGETGVSGNQPEPTTLC